MYFLESRQFENLEFWKFEILNFEILNFEIMVLCFFFMCFSLFSEFWYLFLKFWILNVYNFEILKFEFLKFWKFEFLNFENFISNAGFVQDNPIACCPPCCLLRARCTCLTRGDQDLRFWPYALAWHPESGTPDVLVGWPPLGGGWAYSCLAILGALWVSRCVNLYANW